MGGAEDAAHHVIEHWREQDAEERDAEHAGEDGGAQGLTHLRARAVGDHQREHAQDEGDRGHDDRPQSHLRGFDGCAIDDRRSGKEITSRPPVAVCEDTFTWVLQSIAAFGRITQ